MRDRDRTGRKGGAILKPPSPPLRNGLRVARRIAVPQRAALDGVVEIVLFAGGYAGLQLVEGGQANLCLLVTRSRFDRPGRSYRSPASAKYSQVRTSAGALYQAFPPCAAAKSTAARLSVTLTLRQGRCEARRVLRQL